MYTQNVFTDFDDTSFLTTFHPDIDRLRNLKSLPETPVEIIDLLYFFDKIDYRLTFCNEEDTVRTIARKLFKTNKKLTKLCNWQDLITIFENPKYNIGKYPQLSLYFDIPPMSLKWASNSGQLEVIKYLFNLQHDDQAPDDDMPELV